MYMTEVRLDDTTAPVVGKPLPPDNTTTLIGVPRKVSVPSMDEVDSCSSESPPPSPASVLKNAGVDIDLNTLTPDGSSAPLELLSQVGWYPLNCTLCSRKRLKRFSLAVHELCNEGRV